MALIPSVATLMQRHFPPQEHPYRIYDARIDELVTPGTTVLDIGCGRRAPTLRRLLGRGARLIGVDMVEFEAAAEGLELYRQDLCAMTRIPSESVDLVICRSVMEHVRDAGGAFAEIARVLRPGGRFLFLTANLFDYAALIAALVPNRLHPWIVRVTEGRKEVDTFPTAYRCNTRRRIGRLAAAHGFVIERFEYLGQYPSYLQFNRVLFWLGVRYELFIRRFPRLAFLKGWILAELRKEGGKPRAG